MQRTILSTLTAALLATAIPLASFAAPPSAAEPGYPIDDWLAEVAFTGLALSPDGNRLAFATRQDDPVRDVEEHTLWWIDLAAPEPRKPVRLTTGQREFPELRWAGGDLLVTGSGEEKEGRATNTEGRLHRLEAGQLARIAPDLEGSLQEAVPLADGSVLLTAMISTRTRIYRVEPATSRARTLADHRGTITLFAASRDGSRIAFVRFDRRFPEIWLADGPTDNPDGFAAARVLTSFNAKLDRHPPPEIETVSWSNGEGDTIEGVLLWPPAAKGRRGSRWW